MAHDATQDPTDRPADGAPVRRPGGRTRDVTERITAATLELLVAGGDEVTFANVADRAGVGRATMYRRWSSPADLIVEAVRRAAADAIRIPDLGTLHDDLADVLAQIGTFIASPVGRAAIAAGLTGATAGSAASVTSWTQRWADVRPIFDRAVTRGDVAPDIDAPATFAVLAGALYFRVLVMGQPVDREWIDRTMAVALAVHASP